MESWYQSIPFSVKILLNEALEIACNRPLILPLVCGLKIHWIMLALSLFVLSHDIPSQPLSNVWGCQSHLWCTEPKSIAAMIDLRKTANLVNEGLYLVLVGHLWTYVLQVTLSNLVVWSLVWSISLLLYEKLSFTWTNVSLLPLRQKAAWILPPFGEGFFLDQFSIRLFTK